MKRWDMFAKIKENRSRGLNKSQVARLLEIDYKTVSKYWDMELDEFSELMLHGKLIPHSKFTLSQPKLANKSA